MAAIHLREIAKEAMALRFPFGFPESFQSLVIATEAAARVTFDVALGPPEQRTIGVPAYYDRPRVRADVLAYLEAVCESFAKQACAAVEADEWPLSRLDDSVEAFVEMLLHDTYWRSNRQKLQGVWSKQGYFIEEMQPTVLTREWHHAFLLEVPRLGVLKHAAQVRQTDGGPVPAPVDAKRQMRKTVVEPLLRRKGLTPAKWATLAGLDPSAVYDYLAGKSTPRPDSRNALAEALGISEPDLPQ